MSGQRASGPAILAKPSTTKRIPDKLEDLPGFMQANLERAGCQVMGLEAMMGHLQQDGKRFPPHGCVHTVAGRSTHTLVPSGVFFTL